MSLSMEILVKHDMYIGILYIYDRSSNVVIHFACHRHRQIIVWMFIFLLF